MTTTFDNAETIGQIETVAEVLLHDEIHNNIRQVLDVLNLNEDDTNVLHGLASLLTQHAVRVVSEAIKTAEEMTKEEAFDKAHDNILENISDYYPLAFDDKETSDLQTGFELIDTKPDEAKVYFARALGTDNTLDMSVHAPCLI